MAPSNYELALIAGGFTLVGGLIGSFITHRLSMSRDKHRAISEINKALLDEVKSIEIAFHVSGPISDKSEWISILSRRKLGSVNFTAFKKTCTKQQQAELDAAYDDYNTTEDKFRSFTHLKALIENIINARK